MYIEKVEIRNFKAIENMTIEFHQGTNLLIGDNGAGKTSILEALTVALNGIMTGVSGVPVRNIRQEDIRFSLNLLGGASTGIQYHNPTEVTCHLKYGDERYRWTRSRQDETARLNTKMDDKKISRYFTQIANDPNSVLPLLSFESEARVWQNRRGDFGKELKKS
ncbi:MAG TPA: ATP-binding protein [Candidatus Mediterraneibacter faecigallinarum]|mgnify:FL=1|uniref:ATP-binding protein n=1 Tax=Candidatus Mediterraneibacter faecigallinarum TaxID=2838669 RepID=A0A9D2NV39_9FIRM|nr:ATP-binding protein [Candidatus Mediterraneibacter faecigallinarum]